MHQCWLHDLGDAVFLNLCQGLDPSDDCVTGEAHLHVFKTILLAYAS